LLPQRNNRGGNLYDDRATKKGTRLKHATWNVIGLGDKVEDLSCMEAKIGQWKRKLDNGSENWTMEAKIGQWKQTTKPELQLLKWGS
jgi:hypothetical protein